MAHFTKENGSSTRSMGWECGAHVRLYMHSNSDGPSCLHPLNLSFMSFYFSPLLLIATVSLHIATVLLLIATDLIRNRPGRVSGRYICRRIQQWHGSRKGHLLLGRYVCFPATCVPCMDALLSCIHSMLCSDFCHVPEARWCLVRTLVSYVPDARWCLIVCC